MIVWLWTVSGIVGLALSAWNVRDGDRDVTALRGRDHDAESAARFLRQTERVQGVQYVLIVLSGSLVLVSPHLSPAWRRIAAEVIPWSIIAHAWLLTTNTARSFRYRRRTLRPRGKHDTD